MQTRTTFQDIFTRKTISRMLLIAAGYALAILVATSVTVALLWPNARDLPAMFMVGALYTAMTASAPALLFITACEKFGRPGPGFHALAGVVTALIAHVIFSFIAGGIFYNDFPWLIIASCVGGAVGALSYWKVAVSNMRAEMGAS